MWVKSVTKKEFKWKSNIKFKNNKKKSWNSIIADQCAKENILHTQKKWGNGTSKASFKRNAIPALPSLLFCLFIPRWSVYKKNKYLNSAYVAVA